MTGGSTDPGVGAGPAVTTRPNPLLPGPDIGETQHDPRPDSTGRLRIGMDIGETQHDPRPDSAGRLRIGMDIGETQHDPRADSAGRLRIGMDIGGTKTEAVALDAAGGVVATARIRTTPGADGVVGGAERVVAELAELTGRDVGGFASVGIGIPGLIDRELGEVRSAYNLGIERLPLAERLTAATGLPVSLDNDVTAAAIGAAHLMRLDGIVAYLNLGTGLAAGFVIDGSPIRGGHGVTGEIGHLPLDPLQRPCPCGQRGCLETVASGSALQAYWPAGGDHPGRSLLAAVDAGDPEASMAFKHLADGAAACVRLIALSLDPHTVVIGGGLRLLGGRLLDAIRGTLDGWSAQSPFLASLDLAQRVQFLPEDSPAAAVGAALA